MYKRLGGLRPKSVPRQRIVDMVELGCTRQQIVDMVELGCTRQQIMDLEVGGIGPPLPFSTNRMYKRLGGLRPESVPRQP